jgi:hypothetical protein
MRDSARSRAKWVCVVSFVLPSIMLTASCGSGDNSTLAVDLIDDAVAAVTKTLGDAPAFFEINATPDLVNLFVADTKGNAINFVYDDNGLADETTVAPADGISFRLDSYVFNEDIYSAVEQELPDSILRAFSVTAQTPETQSLEGDEIYRVVIQSERGGQFAVLVNAQGKILGSDSQTGGSGL